jgi:hypothetical protein
MCPAAAAGRAPGEVAIVTPLRRRRYRSDGLVLPPECLQVPGSRLTPVPLDGARFVLTGCGLAALGVRSFRARCRFVVERTPTLAAD